MTSGYLDRHQVQALRSLLAQIPPVLADVVNMECKLSRTTKPTGGGRSKPGSKIPLHLGAVEVADLLHDTLAGWVRYVIEERGGRYPANTTTDLVIWLYRNAATLSLCEGADGIFDELEYAIRECRRMVDIPREDKVIVDPAAVLEAGSALVCLSSIEIIADRLGKHGEGLTRERMRRLIRAFDIQPTAEFADGTKYYKLNEILEAHLRRKAGLKKVPA